MTHPKPGSDKKRIIVDLSFPKDANVNMFIQKNLLFGQTHSHDHPSIDDLVDAARSFDFRCLIGVIDIQRAYRNIPTCPMDLPLLGIKFHGKYYVDAAMPFGARLSSMNMQKIVHFIVRALKTMNIIGFMFLDHLALVLDSSGDPQGQFSGLPWFIRSPNSI